MAARWHLIRASNIQGTNHTLEGTMKGIVLMIVVLIAGLVSSLAGTETEFGVTTNYSSVRDPALMLRAPATQAAAADGAAARLVTDQRSEYRGSRPSVACTVLRLKSKYADMSLQPVFGRINGAQVFLNF
jgi:hypothetical protein